MLETLSKSTSTDTPWGLPWDALFLSLRPTKEQLNTFSSIVTAVTDALTAANVAYDHLVPGGPYGKGTLSVAEQKLHLYAVFHPFNPARYYDAYLKPMLNALTTTKARHFADAVDNGLAVQFALDGFTCRLYAAGELYAGPKELLLYQTNRRDPTPRSSIAVPSTSANLVLEAEMGDFPAPEAQAVHIETSCAVLRIKFIAAQPPLYKDMVRVAKKWRASCDIMLADDVPSDYLLELLMLDAFQGAPCVHPTPDMYATIFRRFLALACTQSSSGSDVLADDAMPKLFLSWTAYYNQGAIDQSIASGLLKTPRARGDRTCLVVVDPAVPFVNVSNTLADWGEFRKSARDSLAKFQNSEMLVSLQTRLNSLTEGMEDTLGKMQKKLEHLQSLEESPRRWSGNIQFREVHLTGESWTAVTEVELRTMTWRVNARRARSDSTGYSSFVDVSLQMLGKPLTRSIDVDVNFRSGTANLVFDANTDHVLFAKSSEALRNRDYPIQITVVA